MKNYELIAELSKYPAGLEVSFDCLCEPSEVEVQDDSDDGEVYLVSKKISYKDIQDAINVRVEAEKKYFREYRVKNEH